MARPLSRNAIWPCFSPPVSYVLSLVVATIGLPRLLTGLQLPPEPSRQAEEDHVRIAAAKAAIRAIETAQRELAKDHADEDLYIDAAARITMELYRQRIDNRARTDAAATGRKVENIERKLRLVGLRAERNHKMAAVRRGRKSCDRRRDASWCAS